MEEDRMVDDTFFGENGIDDIINCTNGRNVACITKDEEEYYPGIKTIDETKESAELLRQAIDNFAPDLANTAFMSILAEDPEAFTLINHDLDTLVHEEVG